MIIIIGLVLKLSRIWNHEWKNCVSTMDENVFLIDKPVKKVIASYFGWEIVDEIIIYSVPSIWRHSFTQQVGILQIIWENHCEFDIGVPETL